MVTPVRKATSLIAFSFGFKLALLHGSVLVYALQIAFQRVQYGMVGENIDAASEAPSMSVLSKPHLVSVHTALLDGYVNFRSSHTP